MQEESESKHVIELCSELLDDIELGRLAADKLLLKCSRLARLVGSDEVKAWINYEMHGYNSSEVLSLDYMTKTGRWTDFQERKGYYGPLAQQEAIIESGKIRIAASKVDSISGDAIVPAINNINRSQQAIHVEISRCSGIRSRVLGLLHSFVSAVYYERKFANLAETTFEKYKKEVDGLIADRAGDVLSKIPSAINRLKEGDDEGISQALVTCRRILEAFADSIFPPCDETIELGGNTVSLDGSKHQNRINAYVAERTDSSSRRKKIRQNLSNLFDRVSSGVHNDVTKEEAFSLFLNVYLLLGEILNLGAGNGN